MSEHNFNAEYDVIVAGFGGAGATAARFASDAGAKVLLVDSAPSGHEGGNTRYAGQIVGAADDYSKMKEYIENLAEPFEPDEELVNAYAKGLTEMPEYFKKYLDVEPFSVKKDWDNSKINLSEMLPEYPEYNGGDTYDVLLVHDGVFDAALWKILRKKVLERKDQIDVWYEAPIVHLITEHNAVIGAEIKRHGQSVRIKATRGVILTTGGFENNVQMKRDYLGYSNLAPIGSLYNKGIGIKLGTEAKARLWNMTNFESLGLQHGLEPVPEVSAQARLILSWPKLSNGSIFTVADDGTRYFNETEDNRHGHIYDHGMWRVPTNNVSPYVIFDEKQLVKIKADPIPWDKFEEQLIEAQSIDELNAKLGLQSGVLQNTVDQFNLEQETENSFDKFGRSTSTMNHFDDGKVYAFQMVQTMLNTQGGPKRNAQAEVVDFENNPIDGLYSAGELGALHVNQYQGGMNIAECLIFGKIAGENAARHERKSLVTSDGFKTSDVDLKSDVQDGEDTNLGENEYLGVSHQGMGDELRVKVHYENEKIINVEVLSQSETDGLGNKAFDKLTSNAVVKNTYNIDAVSGATVTSNAFRDAVKNALDKAKQTSNN